MPISMNSPSASIVATPAGADCSSSASCSTRSLRHPLDIALHALALKAQTTTYSGHCTQAATPQKLFALGPSRFALASLQAALCPLLSLVPRWPERFPPPHPPRLAHPTTLHTLASHF